MENAKNRLQTEARVTGVSGELRRLGNDGAATVDELRQFVGQMRGKSPEEVMGAVANSGLTQGIILSTVGFAAVLLALTIVPYILSGDKPAAAEAAQSNAAPAQAQPAAAAPETPADNQQPAAALAAGESPAPTRSNAEEAVEKLGIGETRASDPNANPLEPNLDGLLDGLDK